VQKIRTRTLSLALALAALSPACQTVATSVEIDAPPGRVWEILVDQETYPEWNPFVRQFRGELRKDGELEVSIQPPEREAMTFHPRIVELKSEERLVWEGRVLLPGVFTGRHHFEVTPLGGNRTRFDHSENFSGILVPFFDFEPVRQGFENMNAALKRRAETN
jgi:hypothetical protein